MRAAVLNIPAYSHVFSELFFLLPCPLEWRRANSGIVGPTRSAHAYRGITLANTPYPVYVSDIYFCSLGVIISQMD